MDGNNWRAAQGQVQMPGQVIGGEPLPAGGMEGGDWRTQLQQDSRRRIVYKIMETLKRHLPYSGQEGLQVLKEIAVRFEEKIYTAATSQSEYLRKISLKMLTMETKYQNPMANSLQSNAASNSRYPQDPASQNMQSQIQNQVQQLPIPMVSNQSQVRQTLLFQNIQNNIPSTGVPNSAGLTTALPAVGGMSQGTMSNVPVHNPNMQNMTNNVTTNAGGKSMGQGVPANMYANSQRQIQGRQQQVASQYSQYLNQQITVFAETVDELFFSNINAEQIAPPIVKISLVGGGDWRTQLQQHSRQRIVSKIMETLKRHLPYSGQEGMQELKKIAVRFEEKIYTAATSQSDYLRKISLKMLTMDVKSENPMVKSSSV